MCSTSNRAACGTAPPRFWHGSGGVRTSTRASTRFAPRRQIETAAAELDWLNQGVFVSTGGRRAGGVVYETYLVQ